MQRRWLFGSSFGPCYGGPCRGAYQDGKSHAEINALSGFYPHFLSGEIIAPKDRESPNAITHIFQVVEMIANGTSVSIKPVGARTWEKNSVGADAYDLATDEEIAMAIAKIMTQDSVAG